MDTPTADSPLEPDITHVNPADQETWFGHPRQLARLFTTEAMERFGYYGMRALLSLYLAKHFLFNDSATNGFYGGFTALVYLTPLVGGLLADRYLGSKRSVKFGAIVMSLGYFVLCFGGQPAKPFAMVGQQRYEVQVEAAQDGERQYLLDAGQRLLIKGQEDGSVTLLAADGAVARTLPKGAFKPDGERSPLYVALLLVGLSLIVVGNGFFKPNISTIVGSLYAQGDRRRDAGFTIFYMGINLGSLFSQLLCPLLAVGMGSWQGLGWWAGFALAAVGMLVSWMLIQFSGRKLEGYGEPPVQTGRDRAPLIYLLSAAVVPLVVFLFYNLMQASAIEAGGSFANYLLAQPLMAKILFAVFLLSIVGIPLWALKAGSKAEAQMMLAAIILIVFNVMFWTGFEQAGSSLTLFADRNTDLSIFGWFSISAGQTQFFNALFVIILAVVFSVLWNALGKRGLEPSIPVKFAAALMLMGAGFLALVWSFRFAGPDFKVGVWWLALLYLLHTMGELCISPVGLSMITKLSIARVIGLMMGVWFLSISFAQYLAGAVAQQANVPTVAGQVTNLKLSLDIYGRVFSALGLTAFAVGVVLLALSPLIKKWMHGVQ